MNAYRFVTVCAGVLALIVSTAQVGSARAQSCEDYGQYIHAVGHLVDALESSPGGPGSPLLCPFGSGMAVYSDGDLRFVDVTDPAEPTISAHYAFGYVGDEYLAMNSLGDFLYLVSYDALKVIHYDGSGDPASVFDLALGGQLSGIAFFGSHAYLADQSIGIRIFSVLDPASPTQVGTFTGAGGLSHLDVVGNTLFTATTDGIFGLYALTDPIAPALIGSTDLGISYPQHFAVVGDLALVVDNDAHLAVVDIADNANPALIGSVYFEGEYVYPTSVAAEGDFAIVAETNGHVYGVDLSVPQSPVQTGIIQTNAYEPYVYAHGGLAYLASHDSPLTIFDISSAAFPPLVGESLVGGSALAVAGDFAYSGSNSTLTVTDASDPGLPGVVVTLDMGGQIVDVAVDGDRLYVVDHYYGLHIFDISLPASPAPLGVAYAPGWPSSIAVSGDWLYMGCDEAGIAVFNVADPLDPYIADWVEVPSEAEDVALAGDHLYVGDDDFGLLVYAVRDPLGYVIPPTLVGLTGVPGYSGAVAVDGNYAYVGGYEGGFSTVDVSNPQRPRVVGHSGYPDDIDSIEVYGKYAFVAGRGGGVAILDISLATAPRMVGTLASDDYATDVAVANGLVYGLEQTCLKISLVQCGWEGTGVGRLPLPLSAALDQNYPNPFNPRTTIRYELGAAQPVTLRVYDLAGHVVQTLVSGEVKSSGAHEVVWSGRDDTGRSVAAGVYLMELVTPEIRETRPMTLLK